MRKKHIVLQLNDDFCALDVEDIIEIMELDTMVRTNSSELNVVLWNNRPLPVLDPRAMLTLSTHEITTKSRIIVLRKQGLEFGILIDEILAVRDVEMSEVAEPVMSDPKYVDGMLPDRVKIFKPTAFLSNSLVEKFKVVSQLQLYHLEDGAKVEGMRAKGKEEVLESVKLRSLNALIKGTRKNVDDAFLNEMMKIHELMSKMM